VRPGDTSKRVDASTEPATVLLEVCDENGAVQIWQGTSEVAGDTVTEDLTNTGSRPRNSAELARAAKWDALDADKAESEAAAASVRSVADGELVGRSAAGDNLSGPEQTALLSELSAAVRDLTILVEGLAAPPD
jgi:hypothetical protein